MKDQGFIDQLLLPKVYNGVVHRLSPIFLVLSKYRGQSLFLFPLELIRDYLIGGYVVSKDVLPISILEGCFVSHFELEHVQFTLSYLLQKLLQIRVAIGTDQLNILLKKLNV